ncbi:helix-turn-helix transcriptional regulator [Rosistilla oblonga]|uniref:helix-turn-helix transcriptional regulator n=1 Tax=Rosistilla oblonga TaxID=2527990 RepID=UPI003A975DB8
MKTTSSEETEQHSGVLSETDVRAIVRLLADVAAFQGDHATRKRMLMGGLSRLVRADGWLWTMTRVDFPTNTPISIGLLHGGLTDEQVAGWIEAGQASSPPSPDSVPLTEILRDGRHFTRTRQQVVPDDDWYSSPNVKRNRLRLGIDHFLYSIYPLDEPGVISAIGLFREVGRDPFDERESRIAHILLSEIDWLHRAEMPTHKGEGVPQLTRRQRTVMIMMLEGRTTKQISKLLHISEYTVKDHAKAIYKHFRVSSQVELIGRFRCGDGGDIPGGNRERELQSNHDEY